MENMAPGNAKTTQRHDKEQDQNAQIKIKPTLHSHPHHCELSLSNTRTGWFGQGYSREKSNLEFHHYDYLLLQ
jgi:hypothetical protein|tara:strand:- start:224 stop:442 length:219 start_codon:yes stop_codon:yes gene_type:complete